MPTITAYVEPHEGANYVLGASRMSRRLLQALPSLPTGRDILSALMSAEILRGCGFQARAVDCLAHLCFVGSDEPGMDGALPGSPRVAAGVPTERADSDNAAVLIKDKAICLWIPTAGLLWHPEAPDMPDGVLSTANEDTEEVLYGQGEPGEYRKAVEWFRLAPGGGVVKLTWGVTPVPSWRHREAALTRQARALLVASAVSRTGTAFVTATA